MKKILLVEDEAIIALSTKKELEKYGYSVITAGTGEKAVEMLKGTLHVDIILMDIDLGRGIDGTEAADQILETQDIPILFLSSHTEQKIVEKTEKITSYGYVVKNSSLTVLDASIKMAFKLYKANLTTKTTLNRFQATLNALPGILFEVGIDGYLYDIYTRSPELLFRPPEEIKGKTILEILPQVPGNIILSAIKEADETGISLGKQYELEVPVGKRIFEISVSRVTSNDPNSHFIYLSRDITNRKKAEELLIASKQKYKQLDHLFRMIADNMQDMLWAKDLNGKFLFVNKSNSQFLSAIDTNEPIGKDDLFFVNRERSLHPDNPEWVTFGELCINSDDEVKESKKTIHIEEYGNIKGKFLFLDVIKSPLWNEKNEMIGTIGAARDITEQKILEKGLMETKKKLALSEKTYKGILNSITENILIIDYEGIILDINTRTSKEYGYTKEYLVGKKMDILSAPEKNNKKEILLKVQDAYNGNNQSINFWGKKKNGSITLMRVNFTQGEYFGKKIVIAVSRDITE